MKRYLYILPIALLITQFALAQDINTSKLDKYFQALEVNDKFMGSVAILKEGNIIYTKQIGYADIESDKKSDKNTKYRVGSISKTFTSTLIFKAIEDGRLSLKQTINSYFPGITNSEKITIGNLLNHRSGIHNFTADKVYLTFNTLPKSEEEMLKIIAIGGSDFEPNKKAQYSNSNYLLLSYILQKVYQKKFSDILDELIINPLKLKNTSFGGKIELSNNECNSYQYEEKWVKQTETDMSIPMGAGGIISTPSDLVLFSHALFTNKLVSESSLKKMKYLQDNYGMGLFKVPFHDNFGFGHTGGIDGFSSVLYYFTNENNAIALTSNGNNYNNNDISIALLSAVFNKPYTIPTFKSFTVSSSDLDKYLGVYSDRNFPLKISITKNGNVLVAQATGQSSFSLAATEKDVFEFDRAGIMLEFNPANNEMTFKQGNSNFIMSKE